MKNTWILWIFIAGIAVAILIAFNHQETTRQVTLSEIFPEETKPEEIGAPIPESAPAAKVPSQNAGESAAASFAEDSLMSKDAVTAEHLRNMPFTIQAASFREAAKAEKILNDLKKKGFPAYLVSKDLGEKGVWHRVYVGGFPSKTEAKGLLAQIQEDYKDSFIVSRPGRK